MLPRMQRVVLLATVMLLAPAAMAGSADDPEITDGTGDATLDILDITKAWVTPLDGNQEVELSIELSSAPPVPGAPTQTGPNARYAFDFVPFDPSGKALVSLDDPGTYTNSYVEAAPQSVGDLESSGEPSDWSFSYGYVYFDGQFNQLNQIASISGRIEGNVITFVLPLGAEQEYVKIPTGSAADGYSFRNLAAASSSWVTVAGIGAGGDDDSAPDDGFGRDFYFTGKESEQGGTEPPVYVDLENASISHSWIEANSDTYIFNWTSNATELDASFQSTVQNGTADLVVMDPSGEERINQTVDADEQQAFEWNDAPPGNWTIRIAYANFTGELSVRIMEPEPETTQTGTETQTASTTTSDTGTQSPTMTDTGTQGGEGDGDEDSNDTPGFSTFALLAILGAALALVRRRID